MIIHIKLEDITGYEGMKFTSYDKAIQYLKDNKPYATFEDRRRAVLSP